MSRCYSCNCILNPQESVRKFKGSGEYTELCSSCLSEISDQVETIEGHSDEDALNEVDYDDEDFDDYKC